MKMKKYDYYCSVGRGYSDIRDLDKNESYSGFVYTSWGIVEVYGQGDKLAMIPCSTFLRIIKDGIVYNRNFTNKKYSKRGVVTKAKQFAREIFEA